MVKTKKQQRGGFSKEQLEVLLNTYLKEKGTGKIISRIEKYAKQGKKDNIINIIYNIINSGVNKPHTYEVLKGQPENHYAHLAQRPRVYDQMEPVANNDRGKKVVKNQEYEIGQYHTTAYNNPSSGYYSVAKPSIPPLYALPPHDYHGNEGEYDIANQYNTVTYQEQQKPHYYSINNADSVYADPPDPVQAAAQAAAPAPSPPAPAQDKVKPTFWEKLTGKKSKGKTSTNAVKPKKGGSSKKTKKRRH